jgi:hypothetical protein
MAQQPFFQQGGNGKLDVCFSQMISKPALEICAYRADGFVKETP